jgi:hypothetical protein
MDSHDSSGTWHVLTENTVLRSLDKEESCGYRVKKSNCMINSYIYHKAPCLQYIQPDRKSISMDTDEIQIEMRNLANRDLAYKHYSHL